MPSISRATTARYENIRFVNIRVEKLVSSPRQFPFALHVEQRTPASRKGWIHGVLIKDLAIAEEYSRPSLIHGLDAQSDVRDVRIINLTVAGRVRLDAADAAVDINPFVSDMTFEGFFGKLKNRHDCIHCERGLFLVSQHARPRLDAL